MPWLSGSSSPVSIWPRWTIPGLRVIKYHGSRVIKYICGKLLWDPIPWCGYWLKAMGRIFIIFGGWTFICDCVVFRRLLTQASSIQELRSFVGLKPLGMKSSQINQLFLFGMELKPGHELFRAAPNTFSHCISGCFFGGLNILSHLRTIPDSGPENVQQPRPFPTGDPSARRWLGYSWSLVLLIVRRSALRASIWGWFTSNNRKNP